MPDIPAELVPTQLPFAKLKRIVSRVLLLESQAALPSDADEQELEALRHVHGGALALDALLGLDDRVDDRLDAHLGQVIGEARRVADKLPRAARALGPVLVELDALGRGVDCANCAQKAGIGEELCKTAGANYHRNVTYGGDCIAQLKRHFDEVHVAVKLLVARSLPAAPAPELALAVRFSEGPPHGFKVDAMVSGEHTAVDIGSRSRGVVALTFQIDTLDLTTYRAITYVLFHELFCHAWDGIGVLPRKKPLDSDGFADGWMDYVAVRALTRWLSGNWTQGPPPPPDRFDREGIAWRFHLARVARPRGTATGSGYQRAAGAEAAQRFLELLSRKFPAEATDLLIAWSLYLSIYRPPGRGRFLRWNPLNPQTDQLLTRIGERNFCEAWGLADIQLSIDKRTSLYRI